MDVDLHLFPSEDEDFALAVARAWDRAHVVATSWTVEALARATEDRLRERYPRARVIPRSRIAMETPSGVRVVYAIRDGRLIDRAD
jgi:hypothetical protein